MKDDDSPASELLDQTREDGMLDKYGRGMLTPRALNRMQINVLDQVLRDPR